MVLNNNILNMKINDRKQENILNKNFKINFGKKKAKNFQNIKKVLPKNKKICKTI